MNKSTMTYYREGKPYIGYDDCYRNNVNSDYLAKARTNCMQLQEYFGRRDSNIDKMCKLCNLGEENLEHFLLICPNLQEKRDINLINRWRNPNTKTQTANLLYKEKECNRTKNRRPDKETMAL